MNLKSNDMYDYDAVVHITGVWRGKYHKHVCLTHWGPVTHICVIKLTIIGSNNGLSPGRRQAIIWTNDGVLFIWPLGISK